MSDHRFISLLAIMWVGVALLSDVGVAQRVSNRVIGDELAPPVRLDLPNHASAAPYWGDIDGDGAPELLVGQYRNSSISLAKLCIYEPENREGLPRFSEGKWFTAGGVEEGVPELCYTGFGPQIVDFNRDGLADVISSAPKGELYLFAGTASGSYAEPQVINYVADERLRRSSFSYNSRVFAHDWEGDGDFDLLIGDAGTLWVTIASGSNMLPPFRSLVPLWLMAPRSSEPVLLPTWLIGMATTCRISSLPACTVISRCTETFPLTNNRSLPGALFSWNHRIRRLRSSRIRRRMPQAIFRGDSHASALPTLIAMASSTFWWATTICKGSVAKFQLRIRRRRTSTPA